MSFFLLNSYPLFVCSYIGWVRSSVGFGILFMLIVHIFIDGSLLPSSDSAAPIVWVIYIIVGVKWISYPLLHNRPSDNNALFFIPRKNVSLVTAGCRWSTAMLHAFVAIIVLPSGCWTMIPSLHCCMLLCGVSTHI